MMIVKVDQSTWRKTHLHATSSIKNPTWPIMGSNLDYYIEKPGDDS